MTSINSRARYSKRGFDENNECAKQQALPFTRHITQTQTLSKMILQRWHWWAIPQSRSSVSPKMLDPKVKLPSVPVRNMYQILFRTCFLLAHISILGSAFGTISPSNTLRTRGVSLPEQRQLLSYLAVCLTADFPPRTKPGGRSGGYGRSNFGT